MVYKTILIRELMIGGTLINSFINYSF